MVVNTATWHFNNRCFSPCDLTNATKELIKTLNALHSQIKKYIYMYILNLPLSFIKNINKTFNFIKVALLFLTLRK